LLRVGKLVLLRASVRGGRGNELSWPLVLGVLDKFGVRDAVPGVFLAAVSTLKIGLETFEAKVDQVTFRAEPMLSILGILLKKMQDLNDNIRKGVFDVMDAIANHQKLGISFVAPYLLTVPPNHASHWRPLLIQLEILYRLIMSKGTDKVHLTTAKVMGICVAAFECKSQKVREQSILVIVEVYKSVGPGIREFLKDQKPALLTELRQKILKVARKDRNQRAAFQRLANIVEPLGPPEAQDGGLGNIIAEKVRPQTFPDHVLAMNSSGGPQGQQALSSSVPFRARVDQAESAIGRPSTVANDANDFAQSQLITNAPTMAPLKPVKKGRLIFS